METSTLMKAANGAAIARPEENARKSLSADLDTFLKLLTAQIENQDPLEPTDGTEYAAQLAQFSSVEQSVRTNELLSEMAEKLSRQDMALAANWIGMDVRHSGPVALQDAPVTLYPDIPTVADRAELVVTNAAGEEVHRRPVDPDISELEWSGQDGRGGSLPPGIYQVGVAAFAGAQDLGSRPVSHYARVREVSLGAAGAELILPGGVVLGAGQMDGLREAARQG